MKIGIIGSGDVAKSLATGLLHHGHDIMLGSSDAAKRGAWAAENKGGRPEVLRKWRSSLNWRYSP